MNLLYDFVAGKKVKKRSPRVASSTDGFTIIEIMVVLVLIVVILLLVFMAVPALGRNSRNHQRDRDAQLLASAVGECLANHAFSVLACDEPDELPLSVDDFIIYSGLHYGREGYSLPPISVPPTLEEPNWLFRLVCSENHKWFNNTEGTGFVVTYYREEANGGFHSRCIDG